MLKCSQPRQRNRSGQLCPPAATFDGSTQMPYAVATSPISRRTCSESRSRLTLRHTRLPCRSNCRTVTHSMASRRRS